MAQLARASSIPDALRAHNLDLPLAGRILEESQRRLLALPPELRRTPAHLIGATPNPKAAEGTPERELAAFFYGRQAALEMGNRLPGGSVKLLGATDYFFMVDPGIPGIAKVLAESPGQLLHMAQEGAELLSKNQAIPGLGTAVRGLPTGGASSRARSWVAENREFAGKMGIDEDTPRFLYPVEISGHTRTLLGLTLETSRTIGQFLGVTFPTVLMTNHEIAATVVKGLLHDTKDWNEDEQRTALVFNQRIVPRFFLEDGKQIEGELFPAGHGDFPYFLAEYHLLQSLQEAGVKFLVYSNADEFGWGPDPVMISAAQRLFNEGYTGVAVVVENSDNLFGGGAVKDPLTDKQFLVETPRLPWDLVCEGKAPLAINTTFNILSVDALAQFSDLIKSAPFSLAVKPLKGRQGGIEQIVGVDTWAGDIFTNPDGAPATYRNAFIWWPRNNFLGIKDGQHVYGTEPVDYLKGRSHSQLVRHIAESIGPIMRAIVRGSQATAAELFRAEYEFASVDTARIGAEIRASSIPPTDVITIATLKDMPQLAERLDPQHRIELDILEQVFMVEGSMEYNVDFREEEGNLIYPYLKVRVGSKRGLARDYVSRADDRWVRASDHKAGTIGRRPQTLFVDRVKKGGELEGYHFVAIPDRAGPQYGTIYLLIGRFNEVYNREKKTELFQYKLETLFRFAGDEELPITEELKAQIAYHFCRLDWSDIFEVSISEIWRNYIRPKLNV
jgi:hypothetical protein